MKAIVFDMDGLMVDTEKVYWAVGRQVARELGTEVSDQTLGRMMGRSPLDSVAIFARDLGLTRTPDELRQMLADRDQRVMRVLEQGVDLMPGLLDVLAEMKPRYRLGIATSARLAMADIVLRSARIGHYFDAVQTSDDVVNGKPEPEIYLKAMARLGVEPGETVVLEDSSNGALAGKRAGAYVIAVPSSHTRDQDFSFADEVAASLADAARRIRALAR